MERCRIRDIELRPPARLTQTDCFPSQLWHSRTPVEGPERVEDCRPRVGRQAVRARRHRRSSTGQFRPLAKGMQWSLEQLVRSESCPMPDTHMSADAGSVAEPAWFIKWQAGSSLVAPQIVNRTYR